jgi:two-component system phosphate regulon sensor histidine kinase PhoR
VRLRIHHRLFAGFLGVVGLMVLLLVIFVGSGLRRELGRTFEEELARQLALGEWIVASSPGASPDSLARAITDRIEYRVSFVGPDGGVLGDSYVERAELPEVENHSDRPEVLGALSGDVTFARRVSATVGVELLYGARRVEIDGMPVVLRIAAPLAEVERAVDRVQGTVAVTGLLAMFLALAVAWWLSLILGRPLTRLADRARELTAGDFSVRATRKSGVAEVEDLATAFNRLTDELRARLSELGRERDEMQALIDCMAEGVVALTDDARLLRTNRAARALLRLPEGPPFAPVGTLVRHPELRETLEGSVVRPVPSREIRLGDRHLLVSSRTLDTGGAVTTLLDVSEIRRVEQVRRDFVANASHELKTPLTSIRGFAETLLEDEPPPELRLKFLTAIRDNTIRLQSLMEDLLDLSRLESGGWVARTEPVEVEEAAHEAWEPYMEVAARRDIELTLDVDLFIQADYQGLVQIFRNLLENALRHTPDGGHIHVAGRRDEEGRAVVEVSDDGEGIPSRALPRIFERFYRADTSRARDMGGTGLGLAIVRHLVDAMGGEVEAESELGRGTTIRFTIPGG